MGIINTLAAIEHEAFEIKYGTELHEIIMREVSQSMLTFNFMNIYNFKVPTVSSIYDVVSQITFSIDMNNEAKGVAAIMILQLWDKEVNESVGYLDKAQLLNLFQEVCMCFEM